MQLEQIFIHISNVNSYSNYANNHILLDFNLSDKRCDKGYQKALIKLPKDLVYTKHCLTMIARQFKNVSKVVLYERENYNTYFLDIYFIDRQLKNDYSKAKSDLVIYRNSGNRMKDISKYNPNNDNHYYVKAGERIPVMINNAPVYSKEKKWGKLITTCKRHFINKNNRRKAIIAKYLNSLLNQLNPKKALLTSKEWGSYGLEFMYKTEMKMLNTYKTKTKEELKREIEFAKKQARMRNNKKMKTIVI